MPNYYYICNTCLEKATKANGRPLIPDEEMEHAVFETRHSMHPTPAEVKGACVCPRCDGLDTTKFFHNLDISGYVRGNGYLDKEGCKRDMNLFKLTEKDSDTGESLDPYKSMRQPGEVDDLKLKLKRGNKKKPKHYDVGAKEASKLPRKRKA